MENSDLLTGPDAREVSLIAWAQSRQWLGKDRLQIRIHPSESPRTILRRLLGNDLPLDQCRVAVDLRIHPWDQPVGKARELAIIPPVSGG
jgi:molybdopterin converting factor small subunit